MKDETLITHAGRDPEKYEGMVNPPIFRGSTVLFPTTEAHRMARRHHQVTYGRAGTPTTFALEETVAAIEGGHRSIALASGAAAVVLPLTALLKAGDHLLVVDTAYGPTRQYCDDVLLRFGVEVTYYDPYIGADIAELIRPNTRVVFCESPGSLTFEVQDLPAISAAAHARGCLVVLDNTWATPLYFKAFEYGVDVSVHAATKYIVGHSDVVMGMVTTTAEIHESIREGIYRFGAPASPEDCWLALRGLRTMAVRLARHQESALRIAEWLEGRPEVARVLYPALPSHPDHGIWKRDFLGACGLFGIVLEDFPREAATAMVDGMRLFGIGSSWGGYESLLIVTNPARLRSAVPWSSEGPTLRMHVGLEHPDDLIADLEEGFARLRAAS